MRGQRHVAHRGVQWSGVACAVDVGEYTDLAVDEPAGYSEVGARRGRRGGRGVARLLLGRRAGGCWAALVVPGTHSRPDSRSIARNKVDGTARESTA